ncbi:MAG TPA: DinB family protein, partial [Chitinophagaceae bacterium]|nr:DinB family protein [Chitinophagaceae bacterium]
VLVPSQNFNPNMKEAINGLLSQSDLWANYMDSVTELELKTPLQYKNYKGEEFSQPLYEILLHVFNHGTYHRGQLVTMIRALGHEEALPQTDFIVWARKVKG